MPRQNKADSESNHRDKKGQIFSCKINCIQAHMIKLVCGQNIRFLFNKFKVRNQSLGLSLGKASISATSTFEKEKNLKNPLPTLGKACTLPQTSLLLPLHSTTTQVVEKCLSITPIVLQIY